MADGFGLAAGQQRAQLEVARPRAFDVELADDQAEILGVSDHRSNMPLAFDAVSVEQRGVPAQPPDAVELPSEVVGIAHRRAQALAQERGHLMGRVAEQEHPPLAPALHDQRVEVVDRDPMQFQVSRVDEARKRLHHRFVAGEVFGFLAREQLDLPPTQIAGPDYVGAGP